MPQPSTTSRVASHPGPLVLLAATLALATGLLVVLAAVAPGVAAADEDTQETVTFADLGDASYVDAVEAIAAKGIINGCDDEMFCPDREVTRGQLATMLVEALELEPVEQQRFTDIDSSVHRDNINAIAVHDIVNGCDDDRFCPDDTITRGQIATMLARAFFLTPSQASHFVDTDGVHGDNVDRVGDAGIAGSCGDPLTHFCVDESVLRWHAATFIARAMRLVERVELAPLEERRAEQERIEAERRAEEERQAAQARAAADPWGISRLSADRIATWERLARCESNGNWRAVSANGLYYGGLQFHPQTWRSVGGSGLPNQATREEQIHRAELLLQKSWATWGNQWPACSRRLGLA